MELKKKTRTMFVHGAIHAVMIALCAATLLPILYTVSVSLSGTNTFMSTTFSLVPADATLANFRAVLFEKPFLRWFLNSLTLSGLTVAFALVISIPAAYAYSRMKFFARRATLYLFLILNGFPTVLSMVAIYRLFRLFGLMNSYAGLAIVYTGGMIIFGIWNMKGYFDTIPVAIEEAARIDGVGFAGMLWKILLPMARPAIIVTAVLIFITTWNEYIYAVNFLTDREKFTLAAGLYSLQGTEYTRNWPVFAAGALLVTAPVLAVFFAIQRHMVSGLTAGGAKY